LALLCLCWWFGWFVIGVMSLNPPCRLMKSLTPRMMFAIRSSHTARSDFKGFGPVEKQQPQIRVMPIPTTTTTTTTKEVRMIEIETYNEPINRSNRG